MGNLCIISQNYLSLFLSPSLSFSFSLSISLFKSSPLIVLNANLRTFSSLFGSIFCDSFVLLFCFNSKKLYREIFQLCLFLFFRISSYTFLSGGSKSEETQFSAITYLAYSVFTKFSKRSIYISYIYVFLLRLENLGKSCDIIEQYLNHLLSK